MRIGITYDLKDDVADSASLPPLPPPVGGGSEALPDDMHEEFDSPVTIEAIAAVLRQLGHEVMLLGDGPVMLRRLLDDQPDFVFNFAEGHGVGRAREARVPAVLEMLGIPHSGSDPLTLAVTLDKDCARRLVASAGIRVPGGAVFQPGDSLDDLAQRAPLPGTCIGKPAWEGSSKGSR